MKCNYCLKDNATIIQEQEGTVESEGLLKVLATWCCCAPWGLYTLLNKKDARKTVNYKFCPDCLKKEKI